MGDSRDPTDATIADDDARDTTPMPAAPFDDTDVLIQIAVRRAATNAEWPPDGPEPAFLAEGTIVPDETNDVPDEGEPDEPRTITQRNAQIFTAVRARTNS